MTGFPSPAMDYVQSRIEVTELVMRHPAATYFIQAGSNGMSRAGIRAGDIMVVDRSLEARHGNLVIAILQGDLHVRKLDSRGGAHKLISPASEPIVIDDLDCTIWGVVTYVIKSCLP